MRQARFAPAVSMKVIRLSIAAGLAAGLFAIGMLSVPATADAGNTTCNNNGIALVSCSSILSGNTINTDIKDIRVLNGLELSFLKLEIDKVLVTLVNLPVQVRIDTLALAVVAILKLLNVDVCQVKVGELGLINNNIAKC